MSSKIINDLKNVPNIVGSLGLNIASAQKALNADYLQNLARIFQMAKEVIGKTPPPDGDGGIAPANPGAAPTPSPADLLKSIVTQMAPVRYVFTETTLNVRLDLAQSFEGGGELAVGGGIGAVMVNAGFSLAFAQEYRGTAECRTVIHVDPRSTPANEALISRAREINSVPLQLGEAPKVDQAIFDGLKELRKSLQP